MFNTYRLQFSNQFITYRHGSSQTLYVQATKKIEHGDFRTQSVRSFFMGLQDKEVGTLTDVVDNMYGVWCRITRADGQIVDCEARDLKVLTFEEFEICKREQIQQRKEERFRNGFIEAKPTLYWYKLILDTNGEDLGQMHSPVPIEVGHTIRFEKDSKTVERLTVKAVDHI